MKGGKSRAEVKRNDSRLSKRPDYAFFAHHGYDLRHKASWMNMISTKELALNACPCSFAFGISGQMEKRKEKARLVLLRSLADDGHMLDSWLGGGDIGGVTIDVRRRCSDGLTLEVVRRALAEELVGSGLAKLVRGEVVGAETDGWQ